MHIAHKILNHTKKVLCPPLNLADGIHLRWAKAYEHDKTLVAFDCGGLMSNRTTPQIAQKAFSTNMPTC